MMQAMSRVNRPSASSVSRSTIVGMNFRNFLLWRPIGVTDAAGQDETTDNALVPGNCLVHDITGSRTSLDWETLPARCFQSIPCNRILVTGVTLSAAIAAVSEAAVI